MTADLVPQDPFDLPEWLGERDVTWLPAGPVRAGHLVIGTLHGGDLVLPCDLLAVDQAWPVPVAEESARRRAHQAWHHGQVDVVLRDGRLALAVPGAGFTADLALDALERLARAVGADPTRFAASLKVGGQ